VLAIRALGKQNIAIPPNFSQTDFFPGIHLTFQCETSDTVNRFPRRLWVITDDKVARRAFAALLHDQILYGCAFESRHTARCESVTSQTDGNSDKPSVPFVLLFQPEPPHCLKPLLLQSSKTYKNVPIRLDNRVGLRAKDMPGDVYSGCRCVDSGTT
jgi:hypothetical protein